MKKKISFMFLLTSLGMLLGLSSCKKERTCTCTWTYDGETETYTFTIPVELNKKDAKKVCEAYTGTDESCKLD